MDEWIARFPLDAVIEKQKERARQWNPAIKKATLKHWKVSGTIVVGPEDLAILEQVRGRVQKKVDLGRAVPTDIFLWGIGKPPKSYLTKIGGVPYRPKDAPWPKAANRPMTFFAQYCFLDSKDLFNRPLPGDIMLVFLKDEDSIYSPGDAGACRIEWYRYPISSRASANECPKAGFNVPRLYGVRHRTCDYPESEEIFQKEGHAQYWLLATSQATRIGGCTWVIQDRKWSPRDRLICTLSYVSVPSLWVEAWPFVNVKSTRNLSKREQKKLEIELCDAGCLYFAIDKKGKVRCYMDSY